MGGAIGGQWLVGDNPDIVARHQAKVYGQAPAYATLSKPATLFARASSGADSLA